MEMIEQARALIRARSTSPAWPPKRLSLALQGGGSFGAFTWGVLDRLLELDIAFDAISGASAGAVNAVLLASGLLQSREEARATLARFWMRMSRTTSFLPATSFATAAFGAGLSAFTRALSPYQFNPFDLNPLREALAAEVDFEGIARAAASEAADRRDQGARWQIADFSASPNYPSRPCSPPPVCR